MGYNPILYYIFFCSNSSNFDQWQLFWLVACHFDIPPSLWSSFYLIYLISATIKYSVIISCIFCVNLKTSHFSKALLPFVGERFLKPQIWVEGVFHSYWVISVCFCCYEKIPQTRWFINNRNLFRTVLENRSLTTGCRHCFLVNVLFWMANYQLAHCTFI